MDAKNMEARLPQEKVIKCRKLIKKYKEAKKIKMCQLESLVGLLNFACQVVPPGRAFLRRLYKLMWSLGERVPHFSLYLSQETRKDLLMSDIFLSQFNGVSVFRRPEVIQASDQGISWFSTDLAFGVVVGDQWASGTFPEEWTAWSMLALSLYPLAVILRCFPEAVKGKNVRFQVTNALLAEAVNKTTSKDSQAMRVLREIVLRSMFLQTLFSAELCSISQHNASNNLARLLALQDLQGLRREHPGLASQPRTSLTPHISLDI